MKWILSLNNVEEFLDEDEEILWSRNEINNLLSFILLSIKAMIFYIGFIMIFYIIYIILGSIIGAILMLSFCIIGVITIIGMTVKHYRKVIKTIPLNRNQLKQYEFFLIITNKQYIRKDYYFHYKRDFSKYPRNILEQIGDTIFLNFACINVIIVDYVLKEINFKTKFFPKDRAFFIGFEEKDEMDNVMEIIKSLIPLNIIEKKNDLYTRYNRIEG